MLVKEFYKTREDGINLYKTYSDLNYFIKQIPTEKIYMEAIDVEDTDYIYEETNMQINTEENIDTEGNI